MKESEEKITLKGMEIPQWYLELEPKLLEQMAAMEQMKAKLDALRMTIYNLMKDEEIDCIDSELAVVTRTRSSFVDSIKKDKLKEEMPEVYDKYLRKTLRKGTLHVRLVTQKE